MSGVLTEAGEKDDLLTDISISRLGHTLLDDGQRRSTPHLGEEETSEMTQMSPGSLGGDVID